MEKGIIKKLLACTLSTVIAAVSFPTARALNTKANDFSEQGIHDGLDWELWYYNLHGSANMTLTENGGFISEWNEIENYIARTGKKWTDEQLKWEETDDIKIQYSVDYKPLGNSYLTVYGWTLNNMAEFFIIENWNSTYPISDYEFVDTIEVDGHNYDVYKTMSYDGPCMGFVDPITVYPIYCSIRKESDIRSDGVVNVTKHLKEWKNLGLNVGSELYEITFNVEGYRSSGYANVKYNYITIGDELINTGELPLKKPDMNKSKGDINSDNIVDIYDLILMRKMFSENVSKRTSDLSCDIDGNGNLAVNDLVLLSSYLLGKIDSFPETL